MVDEASAEKEDNKDVYEFIFDPAHIKPIERVDVKKVSELLPIAFVLDNPLEVIIVH